MLEFQKKLEKFKIICKESSPTIACKIVADKILKPIKNIIFMPIWLLCRIIPLKNSIVFNQFDGSGYADSPKYIAEELHRQKINVKMYWLISNESAKDSLPEYIVPIRYGSLQNIIVMALAKIWISNVRIDLKIYKRKNQKYIQTWHGCLCFKKIEHDAKEKLSKSYIRNAIEDSKKINLFISDSAACTKAIPETFLYSNDIIASGLPRNDIFNNLSLTSINLLKKLLGVDLTKKVLLYAPTFRSNYSIEPYNIDFNLCCKALNQKFGGNWCVLARLHPRMKGLNLSFNCEDVVDVTYYPDIQELLAISDVVISDFSSLVFDYSHLKRPIFLYTPDFDEYMTDRGLYREKTEYPFDFSYNNKELIKSISNFNNQRYLRRLDNFFEKEGIIPAGGASCQLVEIIKNYLCIL